jgi:DNA-binding NtrC family response regulator
VPGLAEHPGDIPILVQHFVKKYGETYGKPFQRLRRRAHVVLRQHDWPRDVRELEKVIASAAITANSDFIDVGDLPEHLHRSRRHSSAAATGWSPLPLDEVRCVHIQRALEICNGNRLRTAQVLGIGRTSSYRSLKRSDKLVSGAALRSA